MSVQSKASILGAAFSLLLGTVAAQAVLPDTVSVSSGPVPVFDAQFGNSFTVPGIAGTVSASSDGSFGVVTQGSTPGSFVSPYNGNSPMSVGPGDPHYYAVQANNNAFITLSFSQAQSSLDILWGSIDYAHLGQNVITFFSGANAIASIDASDLPGKGFSTAGCSSGNQAACGSAVVFMSFANQTFDSVRFTDTFQNAFEFDLVAAPGPIPGAGLLSYIALALLGLGSAAWKRSRARDVPVCRLSWSSSMLSS